MTVTTTSVKAGPFAGNGVTTAFATGFQFFDSDDLTVIQTDASGTETTLTQGTHYTVSGGSGATGTVTMITAPPSGETLLILRNTDDTQSTDFSALSTFSPVIHENQFDRISLRSQEIEEQASRAPHFGPTASAAQIASTVIPPSTTSKYLKIGSTGLLELASATDGSVVISRSVLGALFYPDTTEETSEGVTIADYGYPPLDIRRYGAVLDGSTNDAVAVQAAVDVAEAAGGGIVTVGESGQIQLGAVITIDSDGVIIKGMGGHTGATVFEATHTSGPVFKIEKRSCGVVGARIQSDAARYAASVTDGHGVHVESSDEAQGAGAASSLSRNIFIDLDIRIQPDDGFHNAGGAELITFDTITVSDCKGHGAVFDDGTYSGRTNTDLGPFQFVLRNFRAIENAGNGLILGNQCANGWLINCEGLGNCWDSGARVSLFQFDTTCRSLRVINPDFEDQQYANTTTNATSSTRTALSVPGKGMIVRTAGCIIEQPHGSSLTSLVELAASVDDVAVIDPVTFAGTYGSDNAATITGATAADPVVITTSASHGFSNGDNVYISGVVGMTELNGNAYEVANVTGTTFELTDPYSTIDVDGSAFTAYTSGGTATPVMADAVITAQSNENFRFRGITALNSGCGNMCHNLSRDADIWKDNKHYKGTLVSTSDWEIDGRGIDLTIAGGAVNITGDFVLLTGEGDAADTLNTLRYATGINGYDGFEVTLVNTNAYDITLDHGTTMLFRNNVDVILGQNDAISLRYSEDAGMWLETSAARGNSVQTLTGAGAVDIVSAITHVVTTGADALTLADGVNGQTKFIVMKTDGGAGTLTPSNLGNGTTITFDDVGDSAYLVFTNSAWHFMGGTATLA